MNFKIANKIAISVSIILALFCFGVTFFVFKQSILYAIIFFLAVAVLNFVLVKFTFQHYLNNQFEIIYNILYDGQKKTSSQKTLHNLEVDALKWQQEQQQGLDELQKQNKYRKEFIGNLSHELKTPLFSIQGYVETLLDGAIHDDNINISYLKKASANIDRLSAIINDVDRIAKLESDALNLNKTKFNLFTLIVETIESLELLADKNDIKVTMDSTKTSYIVFADKDKITTVLINLISNAIKYGSENGKTTVKLSELTGRVLVQVSDNGMGIKKELLPRVFERFYRVDNNRSREQGGSGLGLAIVKHIVEAHQQSISVKSELNIGTTFSFTLASL